MGMFIFLNAEIIVSGRDSCVRMKERNGEYGAVGLFRTNIL